MKFLDYQSLLETIQNEAQSSQLTFQTVDTSVLSFSMQLPLYLNTPQTKQIPAIQAPTNEPELSSIILE